MSNGACHEIRLSNCIVVGPVSTDEFAVRTTALASGDEDREEIWSQSRRKLSVDFGARSRDLTDAVREFILARGGPASTFVVEDPTDCRVAEKTLWYDLDDLTEDDRTIYTVDDGIELPLFRGYESGGHRRYRRITKPRPNGFRVWWENDEITDSVTVDFGRGLVTFDYLPSSGRLYFQGGYDLCVRFEGSATFSAITNSTHELSGVTLVEMFGEEDYAPATEQDDIRAALGRTDDELADLVINFKTLVS